MRCSGSPAIREMQIKTNVKYQLTFNKLVNIRKLDTAKDWQEYDDIRMQLFWEQSGCQRRLTALLLP